MPTWEEFAAAAPEMATTGEALLARHGVVLLGTSHKDGTPRISPLESPHYINGQLLLGMMWQSMKARDLLRDARCVIHNAICDPNGGDGEYKVYGRAFPVEDADIRREYGLSVEKRLGWYPEEPYHLFALDIDRVWFTRVAQGEFQKWPNV